MLSKFTIYDTPRPNVKYFEHNTVGEDLAGRMWFEDDNLVDYDGVFSLPDDVIKQMTDKGYNMGYATEEGDYE
jgi:hypothetical protein